MKVSRVQVLQFISKFLVFLALMVFWGLVPLKEAIEDFTAPGTTTRKTIEIVSSYKSPAITFCFTPPYNSSSKLRSDYLGSGRSKEPWHHRTPLWDLFYQSAFVLGRDFDVLAGYYDPSDWKTELDPTLIVLQEGTNELQNGHALELVSMPTMFMGMCYVAIPHFDMEILNNLQLHFQFNTEDKPSLTTFYVTAPNDWSMLTFGPMPHALILELELSNKYYHNVDLEEIDITSMRPGNEKCEYGCRFEQCSTLDYRNVIKLLKSEESFIDQECNQDPCIPFILKGSYYDTFSQFKMCQNITDHFCYFNIFEYNLILSAKSNGTGEQLVSDDCLLSQHTARFEGRTRRELSYPEDLDKEIKVSFQFTSKVLRKEKEEKFFTTLQFFVSVVGSIGAFVNFCLQSLMNQLIDLVLMKFCINHQN